MTARILDLFSGIGGFSLAAHWAGFQTVAFCEVDPFCQKVLAKNFPGVPIYDDVRTLTRERMEGDGIGAIDIICGGYPCQPFSLAGKRGGAEDDRHLWPEMFRLVQEWRPTWVIGENVAGHISLGLDQVLFDLESIGYSSRPLVIPACAVDAPHRRDRVWIVAHSFGYRLQGREKESRVETPKQQLSRFLPPNPWPKDPMPEKNGVAHGIPNRVDRLRALGNAIVPQVAFEIFKAMGE